MGVVAADELVQNTNPYYRSTYVLVHRTADADRFADLDGPLMQLARIGVIAGTPPADLLARKGLIGHIRPTIWWSTPAASSRPAADRGSGEAARSTSRCSGARSPAIGPSASRCRSPRAAQGDPHTGPAPRLPHLDGAPARRARVEAARSTSLIRELQPEIQAILLDYGVPLLGRAGQPDHARALEPVPRPTVPEPAGYRMDKYRAPVPATLAGATVLSTRGACGQLIAKRQPVLVDVLPRQRKPQGRDRASSGSSPSASDIAGLGLAAQRRLSASSRRSSPTGSRRAREADRRRQGRPVVFYCDANCWMSWNAAKRALAELG